MNHHFDPKSIADQPGVKMVVHHFGPKNDIRGVSVGTYMKEVWLAAGHEMPMHAHSHAHQSILADGRALMTVGTRIVPLVGPCVVHIEAGVTHSLEAVTDVSWFCVHATDETEAEHIDERLVT